MITVIPFCKRDGNDVCELVYKTES